MKALCKNYQEKTESVVENGEENVHIQKKATFIARVGKDALSASRNCSLEGWSNIPSCEIELEEAFSCAIRSRQYHQYQLTQKKVLSTP